MSSSNQVYVPMTIFKSIFYPVSVLIIVQTSSEILEDNLWTNLEMAYFLIYHLVTLHLDKNRTYFGLDKYWTN